MKSKNSIEQKFLGLMADLPDSDEFLSRFKKLDQEIASTPEKERYKKVIDFLSLVP